MIVGKHIFTIKQKSKTYSIINPHKDQYFIIGFNKVQHAQRVLYNVHPEAKPHLENKNKIEYDTNIYMDTETTLYIPKMEHYGGITNPMNDGAYHMSFFKRSDFLLLPFVKHLGIILCYDINYEDDKFICFKGTSIYPPE